MDFILEYKCEVMESLHRDNRTTHTHTPQTDKPILIKNLSSALYFSRYLLTDSFSSQCYGAAAWAKTPHVLVYRALLCNHSSASAAAAAPSHTPQPK